MLLRKSGNRNHNGTFPTDIGIKLRKVLKRLNYFANSAYQTALSILLVVLFSRKSTVTKSFRKTRNSLASPCKSMAFVLGNGPSLGEQLSEFSQEISNHDVYTVNFFAL